LRKVRVSLGVEQYEGWFHKWDNATDHTYAIVENDEGICRGHKIEYIRFLEPPVDEETPSSFKMYNSQTGEITTYK